MMTCSGGVQKICGVFHSYLHNCTIGDDVRRFSDVRFALGQSTPRAIALALKAMSERNWVRRTLIDDYPPTAGYTLKPKGLRILAIVQRLQRR